MPPESSGSTGLDDVAGPAGDGPAGDWAQRGASGNDDGWPGAEDGSSWPPVPPAQGQDGRASRRRRSLVMAAVAIVAVGAGAGVTLAVTSELASSSPAPAASGGSAAPGQLGGGGIGAALPAGRQVIQLVLGGQVTAVSRRSITIDGGGHATTAAITSSTRVTGRVTSIGSVRVGDRISAEITETGGQATVTALQDPASLPPALGQP
jgi:hypothetical protein